MNRMVIAFFSACFCLLAADSKIVDAARQHDAAAIRALLGQKTDVNAPSADGDTALHWAAYHDDAEMARTSHGSRRQCECRQPLRRDAALHRLHQWQRAGHRSSAESEGRCRTQ